MLLLASKITLLQRSISESFLSSSPTHLLSHLQTQSTHQLSTSKAKNKIKKWKIKENSLVFVYWKTEIEHILRIVVQVMFGAATFSNCCAKGTFSSPFIHKIRIPFGLLCLCCWIPLLTRRKSNWLNLFNVKVSQFYC